MKEWFVAALIRAVRTIAQAAIAMIGTAVVLDEVNWLMVASAAILAGVLSMLTSIAGIPEVDGGASPLGKHAAPDDQQDAE
jgi:hypothetical protein